MKLDDDDDDTPPGPWVLATYHCYWSVEIHFVVDVDGKPRADWAATNHRNSAYRWASYHAARKYQRAHPQLRGYVVLNLSAIEEQCARSRAIKEADAAAARAAATATATTSGPARRRRDLPRQS